MLLPSLRATALLLVLTCGVYPAAVTAFAKVAAPTSAEGSLVRGASGAIYGSTRIGQAFTHPGYLQGRPSASGYDAAASGGSNLGLTSQKLADRRAAEEARLHTENPDAPGPIPPALLAASGSGLDPELPMDAARWQLPRIAKARRVDVSRVEALLDEQRIAPDLGFLGDPRVNVLTFNLALDRRFPTAR